MDCEAEASLGYIVKTLYRRFGVGRKEEKSWGREEMGEKEEERERRREGDWEGRRERRKWAKKHWGQEILFRSFCPFQTQNEFLMFVNRRIHKNPPVLSSAPFSYPLLSIVIQAQTSHALSTRPRCHSTLRGVPAHEHTNPQKELPSHLEMVGQGIAHKSPEWVSFGDRVFPWLEGPPTF